MERTLTILNRAASVVVAMAIMAIGFVLIVLGLTFLPVIGVLAGIPVMAMSLTFLFPKVRVEERQTATCAENETVCPWPPVYAHEDSSFPHGHAA